ncbi:MAG: hypothetical protein LBG97_00790 [Coriobacteriales bacterium]|nr:hypothetical protein [Coriobacteriales bacterium]
MVQKPPERLRRHQYATLAPKGMAAIIAVIIDLIVVVTTPVIIIVTVVVIIVVIIVGIMTINIAFID